MCVLPLGVVDAGSSQDDANSRCGVVQVVNNQSFFVRGSTDHKHDDVLRSATHTHAHTQNTRTRLCDLRDTDCVLGWMWVLQELVSVCYLSLRLLGPRYGNWLSLSRPLISWSRVSWSRGWCWVYTFSTPWTVTHENTQVILNWNWCQQVKLLQSSDQGTTCVQRLLDREVKSWATYCRD